MDEKDLPSSSDESDADFVPKEEDYNSGSGSEVSDCVSSGDEDGQKSRKRKKRSKKGSKKLKSAGKDDKEQENEPEVEEKSKVDVDALYAEFKKDVNNKITKETTSETEESKKTITNNDPTKEEDSKLKTSIGNSRPKAMPTFPKRSRGGGLSGVLSQIGKKDKMSTLQKSQLDWNNFKKSEGIEEEIKMHNKGKDGYLERQDFLQRTDLRQFEIERDLRSARRKF